MTVDLDKLPKNVLADVRERGFADQRIAWMTPAQVFDEWCIWQGFSDWGPVFRKNLRDIEAAEVKP